MSTSTTNHETVTTSTTTDYDGVQRLWAQCECGASEQWVAFGKATVRTWHANHQRAAAVVAGNSVPTMAALMGETVTTAHTSWCADRGHAAHTVAGRDTGVCPRCGTVTSSATGADAAWDATPVAGPLVATHVGDVEADRRVAELVEAMAAGSADGVERFAITTDDGARTTMVEHHPRHSTPRMVLELVLMRRYGVALDGVAETHTSGTSATAYVAERTPSGRTVRSVTVTIPARFI